MVTTKRALHQGKGIPYGCPPITVDISAASKITSLGRTQLYKLIKEGNLPARKLGKRTLIKYSDLQKMIERLPEYKISRYGKKGRAT